MIIQLRCSFLFLATTWKVRLAYYLVYTHTLTHNPSTASVSAILHSLITASSHSSSISGHIAPPATSLPSPTPPPPPHSGV